MATNAAGQKMIIGQEYYIPSGMGGVYTVEYMGMTPDSDITPDDARKHLLKGVDWFSSQFSNPIFYYTASELAARCTPTDAPTCSCADI